MTKIKGGRECGVGEIVFGNVGATHESPNKPREASVFALRASADSTVAPTCIKENTFVPIPNFLLRHGGASRIENGRNLC